MHYVKVKAVSQQCKMLYFKFETNKEENNDFKKKLYFLYVQKHYIL